MTPTPADDSTVPAEDPPNVTFCITELDPGGAEKALVRFAVGLHERGWHVRVVSLRDRGPLADALESASIPVTALQCGSLLDIRAVPRLTRELHDHPPDVLVCFLHQANIVGRIAGRKAGVRCVASGIRVADRRKTIVWTDRLTRFLTDHYVAVSQYVADVHSELCRIPPSAMSVIYNGVDVTDQMPLRNSAETFRILFVGRLTAQKRPHDLMTAFGLLPEALKQQTHIDLLGDGELAPALQQTIDNEGLDNHVVLHGQQANVADWMKRSDVLVLPSAWEGLPNVVLEAMANGLPVIASSVDGIPEVIHHERTGWLFPSSDTRRLAETITAVADSEAHRKDVARRAFDAVQQRFCWSTSIDKLANLLIDLPFRSSDAKKR